MSVYDVGYAVASVLSDLELMVEIVPPKRDEFVCSSCFLVHHGSQLAGEENGLAFCSECEG